MWRPMEVKSHWEIKKNKKNKMWRPMALDPTIGLHILLNHGEIQKTKIM